MKTFDAIVVGLGAVGSATLWHLARHGVRAVGIDRWVPPHEHGASHGESRLTRIATGEGDEYVPLARRSHVLWREIEAATGTTLFDACGALVIGEAGATHPKKVDFIARTRDVAARAGVPHEILDAASVRERYPPFILRGDETAYFEPGAGMLHPERCIAAQLDLARREGAELMLGEPVRRVEPSGRTTRVETDAERLEAPVVILTAGGWNADLAPGAMRRPVLHRQIFTWFAVERPTDFAPERFPAFIRLEGEAGTSSYGFPFVSGSDGLKISREEFVDGLAGPDALDRDIAPAEIERSYRDAVRDRLAGVGPLCVRARTCFYTQMPDSRFVLARHPGAAGLLTVATCSGHGFKHSAALGEGLAELALAGSPAPTSALAAFISDDRPATL